MKSEKILETNEDKEIFIEAITNPPPANEKLKRAMTNHKKMTKNE